MTEPLTMETLAAKIYVHDEAIASLTGTMKQHIADCNRSQRQTLKLQAKTTAELKKINEAYSGFEKHFELLIAFERNVLILTKWGKPIVGSIILAVISAWATLLAQNYFLHESTVQKATIAAQAATSADQTQGKILKKVTALVPDS